LNPQGKIKVRIGLAEGKTMGDKREALKERELKREMDRVRKGDHD
jgi:SsrA-binding protein